MKAKQKKTTDNKKNLRLGIIISCLILLAVGEIYIVSNHQFGMQSSIMGVVPETFGEVVGYDIAEDNTYTSASEDSYITINDNLQMSKMVKLYFSAPLEQTVAIKIYGMTGEGTLEEVSAQDLEAGSSTCNVKIQKGYYGQLLLNINGTFQLEKVEVTGSSLVRDETKMLLLAALFILLDIAFWKIFSPVRNGKEAKENCKKYCSHLLKNIRNSWDSWNQSIYDRGGKKKCKISVLFVILGAVMGISFSFLIPVAQTPDEPAHVKMIAEEWGVQGCFEQYQQYIDDIRAGSIMTNKNVQQSKKLYVQHMDDHFSYDRLEFHFTPNIRIIRHLPMAVGFLLGMVLHLPIFFCLVLGELGALLFYLFMGYKAIRILPDKKELMCLILLLPVCIQQCSSLNYDAVLIPVANYLIAFMLYCRYEKEQIGWRDIAGMCVMLLVIAIVKIPYIVIGAMIFMIPSKKFNLPCGKIEIMSTIKRRWIVVCVLGAGVIAVGAYVCRGVVYEQLILACIQDAPQFIRVFCGGLAGKLAGYYTSMVANLGWLDTSFSYAFRVYVGVMLLLLTQVYDGTKRIRCRDRVIVLAAFVIVEVLLEVTMLTWSFTLHGLPQGSLTEIRSSLYQITAIEGVQGRYFLPVAILGFLGISDVIHIKKQNVVVLEIVYYFILIYTSVSTLLFRYWI